MSEPTREDIVKIFAHILANPHPSTETLSEESFSYEPTLENSTQPKLSKREKRRNRHET
jgi:hypothetical protein